MKNRHLIKQSTAAVALAMILGFPVAQAEEVYLQAEQYQKMIPYGSSVGAPSHFAAIVNAGFEDDVLADGAWIPTVSGWTNISGSGGTFNPTNAQIPPNGAAEGSNTHFSNNSTYSQTLADVLVAGSYTLTVDVGDRTAPTPWPAGGYQVQLGVDNGGFVLLAEDNSSQTPVDGFITSTVAYTAPAGDANLGAPLVIRLVGAGTQVNFDNVQLEAPSTETVVTMWGYSECTNDTYTVCTEPSSPGPQIDVAADDVTGLTVHLRNLLPEATSIMIAGQANAPLSDPNSVRTADGRLTSFVDVVAPPSSGTPSAITIVNAGFEDDVLADGGFIPTVSGWTNISGSGGTFNPTNAHIPPAGAAEGSNTHYSNGSTYSQTLADVLVAGSYTLTVDVGDRTAPTPWPAGGYQVQLGVDNGGFVLLAEDNNSQTPADGFITSTVNYTAAAGDANLGAPLVIRLVGAGTQVNFDNVQLQQASTVLSAGIYTWPNLRSGSYLYQSGSHVQLQVHMGLYGAMVQDAEGCLSAPCAYDDVGYDTQQVLVFSEIDPALHDPMPKPANATVTGYRPQFFLVNGEPYGAGTPGVAGLAGTNILIRMINAGLDNHTLQLIGGSFEVLGEDGRRAPVSKSLFNTLLPAAKSMDVLFSPTEAGTYPLFDRRLKLVNGPVHGGGMYHEIVVN